MLISFLRYTAPLLLGVLVVLLDFLQNYWPFVPEYASIAILVIIVAPLSELYYLWQRPFHFRYPLLLSIVLLSFHGALGMNHLVASHDLNGQFVLNTLTLGTLTDWLVGGTALMILLVYGLRSYTKQPRRWVDGIKFGLVVLIFGTVILGMFAENWLRILLAEEMARKAFLGGTLLLSSALFLLTHLLELWLLPVPTSPTGYEEMIDEIAT